jgi:hypothetical protein
MFRLMIRFTLCIMVGKAHSLGDTLKSEARLSYRLVIRPSSSFFGIPPPLGFTIECIEDAICKQKVWQGYIERVD